MGVWRWIRRIAVALLVILVLFVGSVLALNWDLIRRAFLGGYHIYETTLPALPAKIQRPAILVFSKTNGFRHEEAIPAGNRLLQRMARNNGWGYFETENGAAFSPQILSRFDAVIFNNVSGDVFTPQQRDAFKTFLLKGGGFVGIHAAGDNSHESWPWYQDEVIGARFVQHTAEPQFQTATVRLENPSHALASGLPASWRHLEEWYSFDKSPRRKGYGILTTVDEKTYEPVGLFGKSLRMGDHPTTWWHCVGRGRVLYTAFGHKAQAYAEPEFRTLLTNATVWALRLKGSECGDAPARGEEAKR